jgi:hypothetical protein
MVDQGHDTTRWDDTAHRRRRKETSPSDWDQIRPAKHTKGTFCRGSSTVPNSEAAGDDHSAVHDREPTVRVQVAAPNPLLEAALEHAVTAAGLRVAPHGGAAIVLLRTPDQPATGTPLDISVDGEHATITLTESPHPAIWAATLDLLRCLFDGKG